MERVALGRLGDSRSEADLVAQVGRVILVFEYKGLADAAVVHSAINAAKLHASAVSKKAIPVDASDDYDSVFCLRATSLFALQVFRGQEALRRVAVSNDALRPYAPVLP